MSETSFFSINPADGKQIAAYPTHSDAHVQKSVKQATKAFEAWRNNTLRERATLLLHIAKVLREQKEKLALLATREMGKPVTQSRDEVEKCAKTLEFYAQEGPKFLADEIVATDALKSYVSYQPLGVVLAVMPWNFPYWQVFRAMAPILMAGNAMILKHASNVSGCALAIEEVLKKAVAPKGLFQTLLLPSAKVADLIAVPEISAVTFTGSTFAGRKIAEAAGRNLKKQVLELGGSDAYIVLEDADMTLAVDTCFNARLVNTGQSCLAAKRFVVVKSVRKEFEKMMLTKMGAATFGSPQDINNKIGPMARIDLREELHQQVLRSIDAGAKLLCGGYLPDGAGAFYPPTLLTNVKKGMAAYSEELFGPVGVIIEAKDEQDALRIANDSEYGLGGALFSKNKRHAERLAATQLDAGNCFVNSPVHSDARLPFGGIKNSGYGRELGIFGAREFVNIKTVFIQ
jgi:succinate-semialdehyde dehydrogenase / glutarate-semialdehyde dehydrogenase